VSLEDREAILSKALGDGVGEFHVSSEPLLFTNMSRVMPHILATGKPTLGAALLDSVCLEEQKSFFGAARSAFDPKGSCIAYPSGMFDGYRHRGWE